jgi:hypothetical protein
VSSEVVRTRELQAQTLQLTKIFLTLKETSLKTFEIYAGGGKLRARLPIRLLLLLIPPLHKPRVTWQFEHDIQH